MKNSMPAVGFIVLGMFSMAVLLANTAKESISDYIEKSADHPRKDIIQPRVMTRYELHSEDHTADVVAVESLWSNYKLQSGRTLTNADVEAAAIEGAVHRLRPKLMTVCAVLASLVPILWESGIGSDVMKPIAAPIVGGMITSTIHVLILVPVFFVMMKERALRKGHLPPRTSGSG